MGDEDEAAEKERRRQLKERKVTHAERELIAQEEKLTAKRQAEQEEVNNFKQFGSRFGVNEVNVEQLKAATAAAKEIEESQIPGSTVRRNNPLV